MAYKIGILNDLHIPFHDPDLVELTLYTFEQIKIDEIIINGDLLDFYNVNMHGPKHSDVISTLEDELNAGFLFLEGLRKRFPDQRIVFNAGNHEHRLDRFIHQNCKVFHNILKLENQLQLDRLNIQYYPYNSAIKIYKSNLYVQHSPPSYSVNGARTSLLKKMDASFIWGCTHRVDMAMITTSTGKNHFSYFNGWLGSTTLTKEHVRVFDYQKGHESWQNGFSIVYLDDNLKEFHVTQIPIVNKSCLVEGEWFYI